MTTDIHAIIAAAKQQREWMKIGPDAPWSQSDSEAEQVIYDHAIAMAEALAKIEHRAKYRKTEGHFCDSRASLDSVHDIARDCLDKIMRSAKP